MFRHQIAQHTSLVNSSSFPSDISAPGAPENFTCTTEVTQQGVLLSWDPPTSGGQVFYYEVYRNGSFLANESTTEFQFDNAVNGDVFKARAVGVRGLTGPFSGTCTYTGDDTLQVQGVGIPDLTSVHILWSDISSSSQISFEGYNVYLDGVKQNGSLLPASMQGYAFFNRSVGTDYTLGVSFVHDGGQESGIFDVVVTAPGQGVRYGAFTQSRFLTARLVRSGDTTSTTRWGAPFGLAVKEGTKVTISPEFSFNIQHQEREWSSPDDYSYKYVFHPEEIFGSAEIYFLEGCGNGLSLTYNRIKQGGGIVIGNPDDGYDTRSASFYIDRLYDLFTMTGPACNDPDRLQISATISLNEEDINDVATFIGDEGHFVKLPTDNNTLTEFDNTNADDVALIWSTFPSTPYYDIYIRTKGGSFPATPNYENLTAGDNFFVIDSLAVGTYEAQVDFKYGDGSIAESSNILEFDIA